MHGRSMQAATHTAAATALDDLAGYQDGPHMAAMMARALHPSDDGLCRISLRAPRRNTPSNEIPQCGIRCRDDAKQSPSDDNKTDQVHNALACAARLSGFAAWTRPSATWPHGKSCNASPSPTTLALALRIKNAVAPDRERAADPFAVLSA